jgi:hypothetical protein
MTIRGIYITANDKALEQSIALLNSIRQYDMETPITLIPYDDNYQKVAQVLGEKYGVKIYSDLEFIERLSLNLYDIFGKNFFARPNQFRKQACWFGEFDEFLYIDTDIVVFEKIIDNLGYFADYDFICYDYQHKAGIKNVFSPKVIEENVFSEEDLKGMFNGGFWASKKNLLSEAQIYDIFKDCAAHTDYFDFTQKTSDQPIINYMILKKVPRRFNLVNSAEKIPGNWAKSPHFKREGDILLDTKQDNTPLKYLHWAGVRIEPGCPYWEIWKHYRYLGETAPSDEEIIAQKPKAKPSLFRKLKQLLKP